jgi:hypothetical protein
METFIENRTIQYEDVVLHTTITQLGFVDRLKILFGARIYINSEIFTGEVVNVKGSKATTIVEKLFKSKSKGMVHKTS